MVVSLVQKKTKNLNVRIWGAKLAKRMLLLLFLIPAGCVGHEQKTNDRVDKTAKPQPWLVDSIDQNPSLSRLGAQQNPRILATYGGEYHDPKLERMVAKIVGRLAATSNNINQGYRVIILDSPNINAFALPGGYVYVTRGLLALANDSAEVAAVIAHEIAHITANHGILRASKEKEIALSSKVATEVLAGSRRDESIIRGKMKLAGFSRKQELQADAIGIKMIAAAGYDAFASPRFLQAMEDYSHFREISGATDASLDFLSNHPTTPQRIRLAMQEARKVSAPGVGEVDRASFLRGINGMIFGDDSKNANFYIRGRTFINTNSGYMFAVPEGFSLSHHNNSVMAAGKNDTALRFDSVALDKPQTAYDYIADGWISGLNRESITTLKINGLSAAQAHAENAKWQFNVLVLMSANRAYRFLTAAPKRAKDPADIGLETARNFHFLSSAERQSIRPLRLRVVKVRPNEKIANLAAQMQFDDHAIELFRIINGFAKNQHVTAGDAVKLIMQ